MGHVIGTAAEMEGLGFDRQRRKIWAWKVWTLVNSYLPFVVKMETLLQNTNASI